MKVACPHFDDCSALCPLNPEMLRDCAWFPDEEVCHRGDLKGTPWLVRQRKIARKTSRDFSRGCFTYAMICHPCEISKGIQGLDPDAGEITPERVRKWIGEHPTAKPMSIAQTAVLERMRSLRKGASTERDGASGVPGEPSPEILESKPIGIHVLAPGERETVADRGTP
jgi:hypothetical protein